MPKTALHELLAVEKDLRTVSDKIRKETINTFIKKDTLFDGIVKKYEALDEKDAYQNAIDSKEIVDTVPDKLLYTSKAVAAGINAIISKEETNSSGNAKSLLQVGEVNFGELSATSLLALEKELVSIRSVYASTPTLDPAKKWEKDKMETGAIFTTGEAKTIRTSKIEDYKVIVQPTDRHPAQTVKTVKDTPIGTYLTTYRSGKISPRDKSTLLGRIDKLVLAVKKARSKANQAEVVKVETGNVIFDYIHGDFIGN